MNDGKVVGAKSAEGARSASAPPRCDHATGGYPGNRPCAMSTRKIYGRATLDWKPMSAMASALACQPAVSPTAPNDITCVPVSVFMDGAGRRTLWGHYARSPKPGSSRSADGNRFTNEAASYHAFTLGIPNAGAVPAFLVADAQAVKKYGSASSCQVPGR